MYCHDDDDVDASGRYAVAPRWSDSSWDSIGGVSRYLKGISESQYDE